MTSGPSKEELEMYWKSSRQYFDELANYYKTADPAYYSQFIAPYYNNPFNRVSSANSGSGVKKILIFTVAVSVMVLSAGIALLFITAKEQKEPDYDNNKRQIESPNEKSYEKDIENIFSDDDFIVGSKYLAGKDYDKAEEHFKKIKPGEKNYKEAQQLLESIKYLKKYDK